MNPGPDSRNVIIGAVVVVLLLGLLWIRSDGRGMNAGRSSVSSTIAPAPQDVPVGADVVSPGADTGTGVPADVTPPR